MSHAPLAAGAPGARIPGRLLRSPSAVIGSVMVVFIVLVAVFAHWLAPHSYTRTDLFMSWSLPDARYLLGGDAVGRDILSRLLVGAQVSLTIAFSVLTIVLIVGTVLGTIAGWHGGWADGLITRATDLTLAFPELIIAIIVAAIMGPGVPAVIVALSLVGWTGIARIVRSLTLSLRNEAFVEAAMAAGTRPAAIIVFHLLPNMVPALVVRATAGIGFIIMEEATLSFLGLGVQEPQPTWGGMIRDGLPALRTEPWMAMAASAALAFTIVGFNLFGDGLRDALDPRGARR
ncbi:oligopeptide transport system permease protein [Devosia enhydra]|uniref:Oligopeptide transport system permease protein n=1 Tax=Devosia enhydra TaxID=665118 RepID=A0A1K2HXR7_9HYPH|nr:ABC transporter permease [Devosia enhydra]SFZ84561.1 oligopeptide transport system permease protein [Devosia enhydra]